MSLDRMNLDGLGFKFKVGDLVRHRAAPKSKEDHWLETRSGLIVTARVAQECSGGVQLQYECRLVGREGMSPLAALHEVELELMPQAEGAS